MSFATGEKTGFGGFVVLGLAALAAALWRTSDDDFELDGIGVVDDDLPPGRALELAVLGEMDADFGDEEVLDNPTVVTSDGGKMRPDVVVLGRRGVRQVREAKDVAELRDEHVLQAARYDDELQPTEGTTLDVADRASISDDVRALAEALDIKLQRWE